MSGLNENYFVSFGGNSFFPKKKTTLFWGRGTLISLPHPYPPILRPAPLLFFFKWKLPPLATKGNQSRHRRRAVIGFLEQLQSRCGFNWPSATPLPSPTIPLCSVDEGRCGAPLHRLQIGHYLNSFRDFALGSRPSKMAPRSPSLAVLALIAL